jgi:effector-binding domain-containing protein
MTTLTELETVQVHVPPALALLRDGTAGLDPDDVSGAMGAAFAELQAIVTKEHLTTAGPPRGIYTAFAPTGTAFTVALPLTRLDHTAATPPGTRVATIAGGSFTRFVHHGPYHDLPSTYERIEEWLRERGAMTTRADWRRLAPVWEEYVVDQSAMPESELVTYIYVPNDGMARGQ